MRHVTVATDFSARSQRALRRAGLIARTTGCAVTLVHVVDDEQPDSLIAVERDEAVRIMAGLTATTAELRDVRCEALVVTGEAFQGILRAAESRGSDLIVMGPHRRQLLRDIFVGTTVERVIRSGPFPVLMVNGPVAGPHVRPLAAIDLSESSVRAVRTALALGLVAADMLAVVHTFTAAGKGKLAAVDVPGAVLGDYVARERDQVRRDLSVFLEASRLTVVETAVHLVEDAPFDAIGRVAGELGADLVIVGTHGRGALARLLLGSVAEAVLRSLDVDVLAVPPLRASEAPEE
ncbi:universal stress protein [Rhodoplanes sp. SY1]|uniref:universal stress protein n=1 Tax=Rhodoplanes sp. SY1 TaxID=3166646 RepID=UPI0038B4BDEB